MKITRFRDIPQFTRSGSYAVDIPLDYFEKRMEEMIHPEDGVTPLQMEPDFQRAHVWTEEQQISYVEFLLRGGKTGRDLYFNCPSWHVSVPDGAYNDFVCVDGLQRSTAILRFLRNEIPAFGTYYREFEDRLSYTQTVRIHVNDLRTKEEVLRWYLEFNSGGTQHTQAELDKVRRLLQEEEAHRGDGSAPGKRK